MIFDGGFLLWCVVAVSMNIFIDFNCLLMHYTSLSFLLSLWPLDVVVHFALVRQLAC